MPPKNSAAPATQAADSAPDNATSPVATPLTEKETNLLITILSLMSDLPEVDYNIVAARTGVKYARNVRTSAKKLFEKLRVMKGDDGGENSADDGQNDSETPSPKKKTPAKKAASSPKKKVSKTTAPKKVTAEPAKAKTIPAVNKAKGKGKQAVKAEETGEDDDMQVDQAEAPVSQVEEEKAENGKTDSELSELDAAAIKGTSE